jgi:hypothetical protein
MVAATCPRGRHVPLITLHQRGCKLDASQRLGNALKVVADRYGLMPGRLVMWLCQGFLYAR